MSNVLIIESSARQQDSISRQLTRQFIGQWRAAHPADRISVRDVALNPVPHPGREFARRLDEGGGAAQ
ncbi:FMN-dependent NADH-azoreductase [Pseudomonas rhodesiae]|nr:FMN-dependent NADH-azoreductase [Pseudomonas rhodesiae]